MSCDINLLIMYWLCYPYLNKFTHFNTFSEAIDLSPSSSDIRGTIHTCNVSFEDSQNLIHQRETTSKIFFYDIISHTSLKIMVNNYFIKNSYL